MLSPVHYLHLGINWHGLKWVYSVDVVYDDIILISSVYIKV